MSHRGVWSFLALCSFALAAGPALAEVQLTARLDVSMTDAQGTAALSLSDDLSELSYRITVDGLSGPITMSHFHSAPAGEDGAPIQPIAGWTGTTVEGVWSGLSLDTVAEILTQRVYINVHTAQYPAGEVRGQVIADSGIHFRAGLTPEQEVGNVVSPARGTLAATLNGDGLDFALTVADLTGAISGAHFHNAPAGQNGGVVFPFTGLFGGGNTASGTWAYAGSTPLTPALVRELLAGRIYANVHTPMYGGGEIRGQLERWTGYGFVGSLTGDQEVPPSGEAARGTGSFVLSPDLRSLSYRITVQGLTGPISLAHFHRGAAGESGNSVRTITAAFDGSTAEGVWRADDDQELERERVVDLFQGRIYVNVHTAAHPGGEIRAQVLLRNGPGYVVPIDGSQEAPPRETPGLGTASVVLAEEGLRFRLTASGLTGAVSGIHFHEAPAGVPGPVVRNLAAEFNGRTADGVWRPSDSQEFDDDSLDALLAGNTYVNLHTAQYPAGEIRGQIPGVGRFIPGQFVRGDANEDGALDVGDPIFVLNYLFLDGEVPDCYKSADANDDGRNDISDPVYTIYALFASGPAIPAPAECGLDPTGDGLTCNRYSPCE